MACSEHLSEVLRQFELGVTSGFEPFSGRGNINLDSFLVFGENRRPAYLLQRVNQDVFPFPERVIAGMAASICAQQQALTALQDEAPDWRSPQLVRTRKGDLYYESDGFWRVQTFIAGTHSTKSLLSVPIAQRKEVAHEVGRGLALYSDLTSQLDPVDLQSSLPGYRDTELYFRLLEAAWEGYRERSQVEPLLPPHAEVRAATEHHFYCALSESERLFRKRDQDVQRAFQIAIEHKELAVGLQLDREIGVIRETAIHGDTKIENFLFCQSTGKVVSLVDLDTVMAHTWLSDWGDMIRSMVNVAGETTTDWENVAVDKDVYRCVAEGFLKTSSTITGSEIERMPLAPAVIALELGVRFLADYLRGDTYFQLAPDDPPDLNRTRALVQIQLFEALLSAKEQAKAMVEEFAAAAAL